MTQANDTEPKGPKIMTAQRTTIDLMEDVLREVVGPDYAHRFPPGTFRRILAEHGREARFEYLTEEEYATQRELLLRERAGIQQWLIEGMRRAYLRGMGKPVDE